MGEILNSLQWNEHVLRLFFWVLMALGILAGVILLIAFAGLFFSKTHVVARSLKLNQTPEAIWQVVSDFANVPSWNGMVVKVERLADKDGHEVWRETYTGNYPMMLESAESTPPRRLVRKIADVKGPFSGRWEFDIAPQETGSRITITEHGEVSNPFFRFMARLFMNPAMYLDLYLKALAGKFGEPAAIE